MSGKHDSGSGVLINFLQQLEHQTVDVELKNATVVSGEVLAVDHTMNVHLKDAKVTVRGQNATHYPQFTVKGTSVRYIRLPANLNYDRMLSKCNE